jgi:hypothetical protein
MTNITSSGLTVQISSAFSTTRSLQSATFVFSSASGAKLNNATVTVPFNGADQTWFGSAASHATGGTFLLQVPFGFSGDTAALGSVSVTLTNQVGTSPAVSGGK